MQFSQTRRYVALFIVLGLSMLLLSVNVVAQRPQQRGDASRTIPDIPTNQWVVKVAPGSSPQAIATAANMNFLGQVANIPGLYLYEKPGISPRDVANTRALTRGLRNAPGVLDAEQNMISHRVTRALTDNPKYADQWHLYNNWGAHANVISAWQTYGYTGTDVVVASVDDGVWNNPDLDGNFRSDLSFNFNTGTTDVNTGGHGTSVAGVMAADNDTNCGVGVAYDAGVAGINVFGIVTEAETAEALNYKYNDIDVYNNSWGPDDYTFQWDGASLVEREALANGVANGRNGKGSIYVWAAGNGRQALDHSGADGYVNSRYTIAVGASNNYGTQSNYSENGAGIVVNAPSSGGSLGISTTASGPTGCTDYFGGTSSAAPLVAGVTALILDANPNLTWRDVIAILIETADKNDPTNLNWTINGAGYDVHPGLGFGRVNAGEAVKLAETWINLDPEVSEESLIKNVGQPIPNGDYIESTIYFTGDINIESVEVIPNITHPYRGDLQIELVSPMGTNSVLLEPRYDSNKNIGDGGDNISSYSFLSMRSWGENSEGSWTLRVKDEYAGFDGTLDNWKLIVHGTPAIEIRDPDALNLIDNPGFENGRDEFKHPVDWKVKNFPNAKVKCNWLKTFTIFDNCTFQGVGTADLVKGKMKSVVKSADLVNYPVADGDWLQLNYQLWSRNLPGNPNFVKIVVVFSEINPATGTYFRQVETYPIVNTNGAWKERIHEVMIVNSAGGGTVREIRLIYFWKRTSGKFRIDDVKLGWTDISASGLLGVESSTRGEPLPLPEAPSGFRD